MGFSVNQLRALRREVQSRHIRKRETNGRELTYIEGAHAIAEANRIFGFAAWNRETVEQRCVLAREIKGAFQAIYIAKVRITVRAEGEIIIREGYGSGDARGQLPGEAHEMAIKTAETDATKRALATFGKPFGLALYLNGKPNHLSKQPHAPRQPEHHWQTGRPDFERRRTFQQRIPGPLTPTETKTALPPKQQGAEGVEQNLKPSAEQNVKPINESAPGRFLIERPRRIRDRGHLQFVAAQPCLLCGRNPSDPHHLRFAQVRAQGLKVSDEFTVPLCRTHHRQLHQAGNEAAWWDDMEIDALAIAKGLWEQSRSTQPPSAPAHPQVTSEERQTR
jgi:hypothetical protein